MSSLLLRIARLERVVLLGVLLVVLAVCGTGCARPAEEGSTSANSNSASALSDVPTSTTEQPAALSEDESQNTEGILSEPSDTNLCAVDETGQNYSFVYDGEEYAVYYEPDTWKVYDSYRITNHQDIVLICQALLDEHPIHGSDLESYRTADDMAFEWEQHNYVYEHLPEDSEWVQSVKDVDLDPEDQGKTFEEMYQSRVAE